MEHRQTDPFPADPAAFDSGVTAARLGAYMNSAPGGFLEVDRNGMILAISEKAQFLLRCRGKMVEGRYVLNIFPQLDRDVLDTALVQGFTVSGYNVNTGTIGFQVNISPTVLEGKILGAVIFLSAYSAVREAPVPERPEELTARWRFSRFVYISEVFSVLIKKAKQAAQLDAAVLITGEVGTETAQLAQSIHNESHRDRRPYLEIPCDVWDSEHIRKMLFVSAGEREGGPSPCAVELCRGGTLFFRNIDRLSPELQYAVYTLITGWYVPEGEVERQRADVRVIADTNQSLRELVGTGAFREDLYYALSVVTLHVPALRERREDLPDIAGFFLESYSREYGKKLHPAAGAVACICRYVWPGNTRELEHFCRKLVLETPYAGISEGVVRQRLRELNEYAMNPAPDNAPEEARRILEALSLCGGSKVKAAELLGISKATLWRHMQKYGITNNYTL